MVNTEGGEHPGGSLLNRTEGGQETKPGTRKTQGGGRGRASQLDLVSRGYSGWQSALHSASARFTFLDSSHKVGLVRMFDICTGW